MSLTVSQQPQEFTPAYNNQFISAISDQYTDPNFKYLVTVTVNGGAIHTESIYPRPDGYMVFNAKRWVENYIEHYFNPEYANNFFVATNKSVNVSVTIFEDYGASPPPAVTTIEYTAFDACLTDEEFYNYDYLDYISDGNNPVSFLGQTFNQVLIDNKVNLNQDLWLHFTLGDIASVDVTYTDGATIDVQSFTPLMNSPSNLYDVYCLNVGSSLFTNPTSTGGIVIEFLDASDNIIETYSFGLTDICTKYTDVEVYYLNRFGNISFFHFDKKSSNKLTKTVNKVRLSKNRLINGVYTYDSWNREVHVVSTESINTGTLNTDWITETQSTALQDLFDSPIAWIRKPFFRKFKYEPIYIKETSYDFKKKVNDKLFNYSIDYDYTDIKSRQRGI